MVSQHHSRCECKDQYGEADFGCCSGPKPAPMAGMCLPQQITGQPIGGSWTVVHNPG